jgi:hypothetical protein
MGIAPPRYNKNKDKKNVPAYVPLPVTPDNRDIIWYLQKKCLKNQKPEAQVGPINEKLEEVGPKSS